MKEELSARSSVIEGGGDDDTATTRIEDGANSDAFVNGALGLLMWGGAVALLIAFRDSLNTDTKSPDFNPVVFFPPLLILGGLYYVAISGGTILRHIRFGRSQLEFTGPGPRMGRRFDGMVRCARDLSPTGPYRVRLSFVETYRVKGNRGYYNLDHVHWEKTEDVTAAGISTKQGVPFSIFPPALEDRTVHQPEPFHFKSLLTWGWGRRKKVLAYNYTPDSVRWILDIRAPMSGINYYATFGIADSTPNPPDDDESEID